MKLFQLRLNKIVRQLSFTFRWTHPVWRSFEDFLLRWEISCVRRKKPLRPVVVCVTGCRWVWEPWGRTEISCNGVWRNSQSPRNPAGRLYRCLYRHRIPVREGYYNQILPSLCHSGSSSLRFLPSICIGLVWNNRAGSPQECSVCRSSRWRRDRCRFCTVHVRYNVCRRVVPDRTHRPIRDRRRKRWLRIFHVRRSWCHKPIWNNHLRSSRYCKRICVAPN